MLRSLLLVVLLAAGPARADVTVFAAASLAGALGDAAQAFEAQGGAHARLVFAGSSALARQIEAGAPADLFVSANTEWMDALQSRALIDPETRVDLLGNSLVLVGPAPVTPVAPAALDLTALLGGGRLAMALVDAVPAGIYGRAALQSLGQWDAVAPQVAQADNVRAALALVATGEAPLGVVYATDAVAEPRVGVVMTFPEGSHPPITYPAAVTMGAAEAAQARAFLDWLQSAEAQAIFARHGFTRPAG